MSVPQNTLFADYIANRGTPEDTFEGKVATAHAAKCFHRGDVKTLKQTEYNETFTVISVDATCRCGKVVKEKREMYVTAGLLRELTEKIGKFTDKR